MPYWAILSTRASLSDAAAVSAAEVAPRDPPEVVVLTIPRRFFPENTTCVSVVAAGLSGVLLRARDAAGTDSYSLLDKARKLHIPLPNDKFSMPPGHLGLLDSPMAGNPYMLVELQPPINMWGEAALVCFSNSVRKWEHKLVDFPAKSRPFVPDGVIAHAGRLYWVDLSWSVITCDPFETKPTLTSVHLPAVLKERSDELEERRCFGVNGDRLRFVDIRMDDKNYMGMKGYRTKGYDKQIVMWSMELKDDFVKWRVDHETPYRKIWNTASYKRLGLPIEVLPVVAVLDFLDRNVIFLYLKEEKVFFGIDMSTGEVVKGPYRPADRVCNQFAGRFVQPWTFMPHPQMIHIDDINEGMSSSCCSTETDELMESPSQRTQSEQFNNESDEEEGLNNDSESDEEEGLNNDSESDEEEGYNDSGSDEEEGFINDSESDEQEGECVFPY